MIKGDYDEIDIDELTSNQSEELLKEIYPKFLKMKKESKEISIRCDSLANQIKQENFEKEILRNEYEELLGKHERLEKKKSEDEQTLRTKLKQIKEEMILLNTQLAKKEKESELQSKELKEKIRNLEEINKRNSNKEINEQKLKEEIENLKLDKRGLMDRFKVIESSKNECFELLNQKNVEIENLKEGYQNLIDRINEENKTEQQKLKDKIEIIENKISLNQPEIEISTESNPKSLKDENLENKDHSITQNSSTKRENLSKENRREKTSNKDEKQLEKMNPDDQERFSPISPQMNILYNQFENLFQDSYSSSLSNHENKEESRTPVPNSSEENYGSQNKFLVFFFSIYFLFTSLLILKVKLPFIILKYLFSRTILISKRIIHKIRTKKKRN